jgi:hypothetical protein
MAGPVNRRDLPRQVLATLRVFRAVSADFDDQFHSWISNFFSNL